MTTVLSLVDAVEPVIQQPHRSRSAENCRKGGGAEEGMSRGGRGEKEGGERMSHARIAPL